MNTHLRLYLWKEWRDQRTVIFGVLLALPLLLGLAAWTRGDALTPSPLLLPPLTAAAGFVLTILTLGMDLLAGEVRRGRVAFLERLPAGLGGAFRAKLTLLAATLVFTSAYGYALGYAVVAWGDTPVWPAWDPLLTRYLVPGTALVLWMFAASAWIPRSALALPGTVLAVLLLAWPVWIFYRPTELVAWTAVEAWAFLVISVLGSVIVAATSFVRGFRFGAQPHRILLFGLVSACGVLGPTWAWTGFRHYRASTISPHSPRFRIAWPCIGVGNKFAFLVIEQHQPLPVGAKVREATKRALRVDLTTGGWEEPGEPGARWSPVGSTLFGAEMLWLYGPGENSQLLSGRTGLPIPEPRDMLPTSHQDAVKLGLDSNYRVWRLVGRGVELMRRIDGGYQKCGIWDPADGRRLDRGQLFLFHIARRAAAAPIWSWRHIKNELVRAYDDGQRTRVWTRKGDWLIGHYWHGTWLIDPETLEPTRLDVETQELGPMLQDGRFLLSSDDGTWVFAPDSGTREPVEMPQSWDGTVTGIHDGRWNSPGPWARDKDEVFYLSGSNSCGLARFDEHAKQFDFAVIRSRSGSLTYLGDFDEESILVCEDEKRLVRHWFGTDRREVLFPR